ncbi:hypothetical protein N7492_003105 [Penicillium capsulatum]|uniref:Uncharacterized protein n=1 Tax=Penicillium capsulatum TaxID=69766 RepID=A0A9W9IN12_9EURO|nr:hypothetical protein N7492_003105 [Penicillium capsulatum]KAJ6122304.1 hypothetical protein N7512_004769 [Penicillium capsulatum]
MSPAYLVIHGLDAPPSHLPGSIAVLVARAPLVEDQETLNDGDERVYSPDESSKLALFPSLSGGRRAGQERLWEELLEDGGSGLQVLISVSQPFDLDKGCKLHPRRLKKSLFRLSLLPRAGQCLPDHLFVYASPNTNLPPPSYPAGIPGHACIDRKPPIVGFGMSAGEIPGEPLSVRHTSNLG